MVPRSARNWIAVNAVQQSNLNKHMRTKTKLLIRGLSLFVVGAAFFSAVAPVQAADKKPNIVILMTDDVGWNDFGYISGGGANLGHPTPNIDRIAKEGAFHQLVRPGELHRRPRLAHHGAHSHPLGAVDRGRTG
jgi:hypothetical protein